MSAETSTAISPASGYTAARIAATLGRSPQAIRKALRGVVADGLVIVHGKPASAWLLTSLPSGLREDLEARARHGGYVNAEVMLAQPPLIWQPQVRIGKGLAPVKIGELRQDCVDAAAKLQRVLLPVLERVRDEKLDADSPLSWEAIIALIIQGHLDQYGRKITGRYARHLLDRTLKRDEGAQDYGRLEIYLPDRLARRKAQPHTGSQADTSRADAPNLVDFIAACPNPATLSPAEQQEVWKRACEDHADLIRNGVSAKAATRRIAAVLLARCPALATSRDGFRKALARHIDRENDQVEHGDGRANNGREGYQFPQADLDHVESLLVGVYGQYNSAWKHAHRKGLLAQETLGRFDYKRCPERVKELLGGQLPIWMHQYHRRRRDFGHQKAHADCLYDGLNTLDLLSADDVTLPVWMWYQDRMDSAPIVTRGQCLIYIDVLSRRILGWSLQPERNYNALVIYTQTARVLSEKGLCKAMIWERGIWERSKLLGGKTRFSVAEVIKGFRDFADIRFFHVHTPEGKHEVENVMARIQDLMEDQPGYAGRAEIYDRPDWINKQLAEVQAANGPHPSKYFLSFEQWNEKLGSIIEEYNSLPQGGKHMQDRSPDEIYYAHWPVQDPPSFCPPALRFRLATAFYEKEVGPDGIRIQNGKRTFKYFGPELGPLVGKRVRAGFDPQFPDLLTVTDMDEQNPIIVPLHNGVPRAEQLTDPDGHRLADFCERRESQVAHIVARYNVVKDRIAMPYRRPLPAPEQEQLGQRIADLKAAARKTEQAQDQRRKAQRAVGITAPPNARFSATSGESLKKLARLLAEEPEERTEA